jgi:hypothetical protein
MRLVLATSVVAPQVAVISGGGGASTAGQPVGILMAVTKAS